MKEHSVCFRRYSDFLVCVLDPDQEDLERRGFRTLEECDIRARVHLRLKFRKLFRRLLICGQIGAPAPFLVGLEK